MAQEKWLDVSDLEAPAPLVDTLEAAQMLASGEYLHMMHRRDPCLLREHLDQQNFGYITHRQKDGSVHTFIWRRGDTEADVAAHTAAEGDSS